MYVYIYVYIYPKLPKNILIIVVLHKPIFKIVAVRGKYCPQGILRSSKLVPHDPHDVCINFFSKMSFYRLPSRSLLRAERFNLRSIMVVIMHISYFTDNCRNTATYIYIYIYVSIYVYV